MSSSDKTSAIQAFLLTAAPCYARTDANNVFYDIPRRPKLEPQHDFKGFGASRSIRHTALVAPIAAPKAMPSTDRFQKAARV